MEATLVLIKPDGVQKRLIGNIITRLSETRLDIIAAKMCVVDRDLATEHYRDLKGKEFFEELVKFIIGEYHTNQVLAMVYRGKDAIVKVREKCGATNPEEADPHSIRGAYGRITTSGIFENVVHASSNKRDAEREIKLWFKPNELIVRNLFPTEEVVTKIKIMKWA